MDKAREFLEKLTAGEDADSVSRLTFPPHRAISESSFYEFFAVRGVRVAVVHPDSASCSFEFKVPPRLVDSNGNLAMAALTNLIDVLGAAVAYRGDLSMNVSADMSISRISTAKLDDELDISSRCLGRKGGYYGTHVLVRNKTTGEIVAEGRHSVFGGSSASSKL